MRRMRTLVLRVAIVGKPNVGKSSIINRAYLVRAACDRISDIAGTTRDAIDTVVVHNGNRSMSLLIQQVFAEESKMKEDTGAIFSIIRTVTAVEQCRCGNTCRN